MHGSLSVFTTATYTATRILNFAHNTKIRRKFISSPSQKAKNNKKDFKSVAKTTGTAVIRIIQNQKIRGVLKC